MKIKITEGVFSQELNGILSARQVRRESSETASCRGDGRRKIIPRSLQAELPGVGTAALLWCETFWQAALVFPWYLFSFKCVVIKLEELGT